MLPSFVIGLREGLEAALIVGIIAAFLRKQGRRDLLRWVMVGVGVAVVLCLGAGIALRVFSQNLPQRQQEGLETVIAVIAIGMVTYMVVWMRRNSRTLKGQLEGLASEAISGRSNAGTAMVLMAFLAVIREGLETVVFLLAAFNETSSGATAGIGALLGIAIAVALGYGIYRGGVRLNLSKFFRVTGLVLVLVAAGLVVNAFHTAHEAGWVDFGQGRTIDLTWLVEPGTVQASLLTGMLGLQPRPVTVEVIAWLVYLIPVGLYVAWPPGRPAPTRLAVRGGLALGTLAAVVAAVLAFTVPAAPQSRPVTTGGGVSAQVLSRSGGSAAVRLSGPIVESAATRTMRLAAAENRSGLAVERFSSTAVTDSAGSGRPSTMSVARVAELNGARIPFGVRATGGVVPVRYQDSTTVTVWLDATTDRVVDVRSTARTIVVAGTADTNAALSDPIATSSATLPADASVTAVQAAKDDHARSDSRSTRQAFVGWLAAVALVSLLIALGFALAARRTGTPVAAQPQPVPDLVKS